MLVYSGWFVEIQCVVVVAIFNVLKNYFRGERVVVLGNSEEQASVLVDFEAREKTFGEGEDSNGMQ